MISKSFLYIPLIKSRPVPQHPEMQQIPWHDSNESALVRWDNEQRRKQWDIARLAAEKGPLAWIITYWNEGSDVWLECGPWGLILTHRRHFQRRLFGFHCFGKGART